MPSLDPQQQREFALDVLRRLREAGFQAYWAGGCVRDQLLGRTPKDYDVATDARPDQVRELFGRRRTVAVGAAFGVIMVVGPGASGQVEVTTFRLEAGYTDGRHPDTVTFSSAEEDASRRDFTINGLFMDPVENRILDFVGGQADLARKVIRAIGNPAERFAEDKLRMLRAVRFAATFDFVLDDETLAAVRRTAADIVVVSPERIATEMRRLLVGQHRVRGVRLLIDSLLAQNVLPEVIPGDRAASDLLDRRLAVLAQLVEPDFPLALAALMIEFVDPEGIHRLAARWRLANKETDTAAWLVEHARSLDGAQGQPRSRLFRILAQPDAGLLCDLVAASARAGVADPADAAWCWELLNGPRERYDPTPLLNGTDLLRHGVRPGPVFRHLLETVRDAQLEGEVATREQALALVDRLRQ